MDGVKTYLVCGVVLVLMVSAMPGLSSPTIWPKEQELELEPNSLINISCTGESEVVWEEPLPDGAIVTSNGFTATLLIYNATINHTRYYDCRYKKNEGDPSDLTEIYILVKDPHILFVPEEPENLVVPHEAEVVIPCRASHLSHAVELIRIPNNEKLHRFYDHRMGFIGELPPGQYLCEATLNGQTYQSSTYTVKKVEPQEVNDFEVEVKASKETVRVRQPFNVSCISPFGPAFHQQWIHLKTQARCSHFLLFICIPVISNWSFLRRHPAFIKVRFLLFSSHIFMPLR
ncbi:hypothetical protein XENOCAPTIV_012877 [Xenoophorus captivus]|uniref:Uncharacterized protein n=1 Tax=Xenoophorus captivus TaxID=1517983 RepID=A0ABV0RJ65_9TELE